MKKYIVFLYSLCALFTKSYAQKIYISISGGYGLSTSPNSNYASTNSTRNSNGNTALFTNSISNSTGSFGRGVQFGATLGYEHNRNFSVELNTSYLISDKITSTLSGDGGTIYSEDKSSATMLRLIPAIKVSIGEKKLKPYLRFGLVIGLVPKINFTETYTNTSANPNYSESVYVYSGGISIGYSAGLGVNYKVTNRLSLFGEIGLISQAWAPKKSVLTKATQNGIDMLPSKSLSQKEIDYVSSYTDNSSVNPSLPSKSLKTYMPFSSIGINVGLQIAIGKQK